MLRGKRREKKRVLFMFCGSLLSVVILCLYFLLAGERPATETSPFGHYDRLVLVPGHSAFNGTDFTDIYNPNSWHLKPFQYGQLETIITHAKTAVKLASEDENSILVFSGGQTRQDMAPLSEGQSYWMTADAQNWFGSPNVRARAHTEEFALDSFQNLANSLCRFKEITGSYPKKVTVVGFEFKRARFSQLHRETLGLPQERFEYVGIDPTMSDADSRKLAESELKNAFEPFEMDPRGCSKVLMAKKEGRNPFHRVPPYLASCPALASFFDCAVRRASPPSWK